MKVNGSRRRVKIRNPALIAVGAVIGIVMLVGLIYAVNEMVMWVARNGAK